MNSYFSLRHAAAIAAALTLCLGAAPGAFAADRHSGSDSSSSSTSARHDSSAESTSERGDGSNGESRKGKDSEASPKDSSDAKEPSSLPASGSSADAGSGKAAQESPSNASPSQGTASPSLGTDAKPASGNPTPVEAGGAAGAGSSASNTGSKPADSTPAPGIAAENAPASPVEVPASPAAPLVSTAIAAAAPAVNVVNVVTVTPVVTTALLVASDPAPANSFSGLPGALMTAALPAQDVAAAPTVFTQAVLGVGMTVTPTSNLNVGQAAHASFIIRPETSGNRLVSPLFGQARVFTLLAWAIANAGLVALIRRRRVRVRPMTPVTLGTWRYQ
ncbi:MAG: hypothetical protein ACYDGR_08270 [Candidatus Dormibacteria bacterium]